MDTGAQVGTGAQVVHRREPGAASGWLLEFMSIIPHEKTTVKTLAMARQVGMVRRVGTARQVVMVRRVAMVRQVAMVRRVVTVQQVDIL